MELAMRTPSIGEIGYTRSVARDERQPPAGGRLSRRDFLRAAAGASLVGAFPQVSCTAFARKPNIVFIMADDLGYESLGSSGGTAYQTPQLDRLAATGIRFTHAYGTPLCTPSRVQVMSGQYPFRTGYTGGLWETPLAVRAVNPALIDMAAVLKRAGYATAVAGKWQLALFAKHPEHATEAGFDEHCLWTWDYRAGQFKGSFRRYWRPGVWRNGKLDREVHRDDVYGPDVFADFLIDFIRRNRGGPFFAYYPMVLPHRPFFPTPDNRLEYDVESLGPTAGLEGAQRNVFFPGMVAYMDKLVGRVLAALDELDLRERTLVLFTSDNGNPEGITTEVGEATIPSGKGQLGPFGAHVPLIANWRGTTPGGAVCEDLTDSTDILPTFASLAEAALPGRSPLDGQSLAPQLRGEEAVARRWVHIQLGDSRVVRGKRFGLFNDGRLYDLEGDPLQEHPIAAGQGGPAAESARAEYQDVLDRLR
jgi:arylsulfatase A-like enzyme